MKVAAPEETRAVKSRRWLAARLLLSVVAVTLVFGVALADWLQPDASMREANTMLRIAVRDTAGHADDPARLDTLGISLMRLCKLKEAEASFRRSLELSPGNEGAAAGLGKILLFQDRLSEAESLLAGAEAQPGADYDLYAAKLRKGDLQGAAALCEDAGEAGRKPLLLAVAERGGAYQVSGPEEVKVSWAGGYPVPLVRVKLNGKPVLMAIDTGSRDLLIDASAARLYQVQPVEGQSPVFWCGTRLAVRNALVQKLEIGGLTIQSLPAGVTALRKWSLQVHPRAEKVVGVLGLGFLKAFTPTLDYKAQTLTLRRGAATFKPDAGAQRVPFEIWGESELTVYGSISGGRRMAMVVQSGVPECGVGAPPEVFEEVGARSGLMSRAVKSAGTWLSGRPWLGLSVPTLSVGPIVEDKVAGWSGALDSAELWRHGVRRDALLSHDFFAGKRVTYDWSGHALVFE
jgi:hypothetical protein